MKKLLLLGLFLLLFTGCKEVEVIEDPGPLTDTVAAVRGGNLSSLAHNVSGNVTVYEDNSIDVVLFNYDGRAPDVYFALGHYNNGEFVYEILITDIITEAFVDDTYEIIVDDDINLDDYEAISVWCHEFSEDFGSTELKVFETSE